MIDWIKGYLFLIKQYKNAKRLESNLFKAKKHAILALAYWKECEEQTGLHFQIEDSEIFVRLGKIKEHLK